MNSRMSGSASGTSFICNQIKAIGKGYDKAKPRGSHPRTELLRIGSSGISARLAQKGGSGSEGHSKRDDPSTESHRGFKLSGSFQLGRKVGGNSTLMVKPPLQIAKSEAALSVAPSSSASTGSLSGGFERFNSTPHKFNGDQRSVTALNAPSHLASPRFTQS